MVIQFVSAATPPAGRGRCVAMAANGSEKSARVLVSCRRLSWYDALQNVTYGSAGRARSGASSNKTDIVRTRVPFQQRQI